jgi:hypothetical protein
MLSVVMLSVVAPLERLTRDSGQAYYKKIVNYGQKSFIKFVPERL